MGANASRAFANAYDLDANPVAKNLPYLPLGPPARRKKRSRPSGCGGLPSPSSGAPGQIISANTIITYDVCCYFTDKDLPRGSAQARR
jgi:hypothetical protein